MKVVNFYKLPRPIQDRFVGSVMSGFPPAPLLARVGGAQTNVRWIGVSIVSFLLLAVTLAIGYGQLDSRLAIQSPKALIVYTLLVFGMAYGFVHIWTRHVRGQGLPYTAGVYLFPACLIDAQTDRFAVYDIKDLVSANAQDNSVRVSFRKRGSFLFFAADASAAAAIATEVWAERERAMRAQETEDQKELVAVDPLHNPRFSSPVGPRDAYQVKMPFWGRYGIVAASVVALAGADALWVFRNEGSDRAMYKRAKAVNDTASFRAYLARGRIHASQVRDVDLPRAELNEAIATGSVDALLAFKSAHPTTKISGDLADAVRKAMLAELGRAKDKGTLAALEDFAKRYPKSGVEPELHDAIHAVFVRDFETFKKSAPANDKNALSFTERLFAWAEKHDGRVEIRFRRKKSESLGRADAFVGKTPSFAGDVSYPTHYFDEKHTVRHEQNLGKRLADRFNAGLASEIFEFVRGASVPDVELPEVSTPTLFVTYSVEWSGHSYTARRPHGVYIGIIFPFEGQFVIPGDPKPFKFKYDVFKPAALQQLKDDNTLQPGTAEEKVYNAMGAEAFEQFGDRLASRFIDERATGSP